MSRTPWICRLHHLGNNVNRLQRRLQHSLLKNSRFLRVSEEVEQAVAEKRAVVALESTIYTHGFPHPENLALASRLESLVRAHGGVPATIGVLNGVARIGLKSDELSQLVTSPSDNLLKVSRRDLGFALGARGHDGQPFSGGTTVAGTMILAHLAGVKIFATGGLGGVHRGAEQTMDVSADLTELGRTPVTVISSGCKSFLDIPKTLEYLETQGVAVATFADGRNGAVSFPAFYTRDSGVRSPMVLQDEVEAARVVYAQQALGLQSGSLFANPIPQSHSVPFQEMEDTIERALHEARQAGATGAASTPYILAKIKDLTGSRSVEANTALVEANVIRGTKVAVALSSLEAGNELDSSSALNERYHEHTFIDDEELADDRRSQHSNVITGPGAANFTSQGVTIGVATHKSSKHERTTVVDKHALPSRSAPDVFVAGSLAVDLSCDYTPRASSGSTSPSLQTSNPARIAQSLGGVGHNVARAAHLMGADVQLCSVVGDDLTGKAALEALSSAAMSEAGVNVASKTSGARTAQYIAVNDVNRDLVLAMADMSVLEQPKSGEDIVTRAFDSLWLPQLQQHRPTHLVMDGNWQPTYLARWLSAGHEINAHVAFEPVSNVKSTGIFHLPSSHKLSVFPTPSIHLATPNAHELAAMYSAARETGHFDRADWWRVIDALGIPATGARVQLALATTSALVDQGLPQQSIQLLPFISSICTKLGSQGVLLTQLLPANDPRLTSGEYAPYILSRCTNGTEDEDGVGGVYMRLFPAIEEVPVEEVVSVNGVGDTFAGTLVAGMAKRRKENKEARVENLIDLAQRAAVLTLRSHESVSPGLGTLRMLL